MMSIKYKNRFLAILFALILVIELVAIPLTNRVNAMDNPEGTSGSLIRVTVSDTEGNVFSEDNLATAESIIKFAFTFQLPNGAEKADQSVTVEIPDGIVLADDSGSLINGKGTYKINENKLITTLENQENKIAEDSLELIGHFSEDVLKYVEGGVLNLKFVDETDTEVEIPFAEPEVENAILQTEETTVQTEETTAQTEEKTVQTKDETKQSVGSIALSPEISLFSVADVADIMFTDITDFVSSNGTATMTYVNTINGNADHYKEIKIIANFGGDFDVSVVTITVLEIVVNGSGISVEQAAEPSDYTISGTTVTFTDTGTKQFVVRYENVSTQTSYLNSYGEDLDSGPAGLAEFVVKTTDDLDTTDTYSYCRNFQPLTVDTEGQEPGTVPNINLHLNTILTGLSSTTVGGAGETIKLTYKFSLNNLMYAVDAAKKMNTALDNSEKGNYSGKLNVHAGDYFVFHIDTSKITIGNNVTDVLNIGGKAHGYYSLDSATSTMTFVFTREAELSQDITGEIDISTTTSGSLQPGDEITTLINGEGETSVVIYHPTIEIYNTGERDDANQQVVWTITANEGNHQVKNMVIFDNSQFAAEGGGNTDFVLVGKNTYYPGGYGLGVNRWVFNDYATGFEVAAIDKSGNETTLTLNTDYKISSASTNSTAIWGLTYTYDCQRYIELIGDYATTSAVIKVKITGAMTNLTDGSTTHYFMNYASVSGSNITTSVAEDIKVDDSNITSAVGSAYISNIGVKKSRASSGFVDNDSKYKLSWEIIYNLAGADIDPAYAYVKDQPTLSTATTAANYSYYTTMGTDRMGYMTFVEPNDANDIIVQSYVPSTSADTPVTFTQGIDYEVIKTAVTIETGTQYEVTIQFKLTSNTSTDGKHINIPVTIYYDQYAQYDMPANAAGMRFNNYAVTAAGYSSYSGDTLLGFKKTASTTYAANTTKYTVTIDPTYIPFGDEYRIYDILPQGYTLTNDAFTITATNAANGDAVGMPKVVLSGNAASSDQSEGYFELVTGEDFGQISSNPNYKKDKDFYLIFHEGSIFTDSLKYEIVYQTSFLYESQDPEGTKSKDYAVSSTSNYSMNIAYLYNGDKLNDGKLLTRASISITNSDEYNKVNMAKVGGYSRSVAADEEKGITGSNPKITWRVYGNIWNNNLNGAVLNDTLGVGATSGGVTDLNLTQAIDVNSIKLYVFNRSLGKTVTTITSDSGSVTVPAGEIGTVDLLDPIYNLGIIVDTGTSGKLRITFPDDYKDRLKASGIEGTIDSIGSVNTRFVLEYETDLESSNLDNPFYSNEVTLDRSTVTSDAGTLNYTDSASGTVEIKEFTDGTYANTKIGVYDGKEKLIHYTAVLNKGAQIISGDGNNNPTIHDTLYYSVNETTGEAEQQILYLIRDSLKVYEAKPSSTAENGYAAANLLEQGVDYDLIYNQDERNGFNIVFTDSYHSVNTAIIVEYDAAYNHVTVPAYVKNEIYFVGYQTYTSGDVTVYVSETTVTSGWTRQLIDLNILKVDEKGNPMKNVKFALVDKNGVYRIDSQTTDANGVATFTNLLEDTYYIYEVNLPDGYGNSYNTLKNAARFTFSSNRIAADPEEFEFTISLSEGTDTNSLIIQYEDSDEKKTDTKATVPDTDLDTTYLKFTNTSGYTANIEATKYDPYTIDPYTNEGIILTDAEFYVYRYYEKSNGEVVKEYYKEDGASSNNGIAVFTDQKNDAYPFKTINDGKFTIANLPIGIYYLEEITVPNNYEAPSSDFEIEITKSMIDDFKMEDPNAASVIFKKKIPNQKKTGSITINKKNSNDECLSGVYFLLEVYSDTTGAYHSIYYNTETWLWEEITDGSTYSGITDSNGQLVFESLPEGDYKITEVKTASDDYTLMAEPIKVSIPYELVVAAGKSVSPGYDSTKTEGEQDYYYYYNLTYTIVNSNIWGLPEAGGLNGTLRLDLFAGLACIMAATVLYVVRSRKKTKHHSRE